ncbi:MAG: transcriptional repressor [Armatimonadetes bacterium RBG_16_58_9]|nr:MAG: transcriptional repressor [Armatimonadetes bacterium RBG_16_58_9]
MEPGQDELERRMHHLKEGLKQAGVKLTHQRLEICREIASASNHPDAEAVFKGVRERVPTISLDTVYRTLWTLLDLGLIDTLGIPRERMRFDGNIAPHHHFVCTKCGEARDFYSEDFDQLQVPDDVKTYGIVQKTQVEVRGVCLRCSKTTDP